MCGKEIMENCFKFILADLKILRSTTRSVSKYMPIAKKLLFCVVCVRACNGAH